MYVFTNTKLIYTVHGHILCQHFYFWCDYAINRLTALISINNIKIIHQNQYHKNNLDQIYSAMAQPTL